MFIRIATYTINTDSITHARQSEDGNSVEVFFIGGSSVTLEGEDAAYFIKVAQRLSGT